MVRSTVFLTEKLTGSAAKIFTLEMRKFSHVTTMGTPAFGAISEVMDYTLPNGWHLGMSLQQYVPVNGDVYEGVRTLPDISIIPSGPELLDDQDEALSQAIQFLTD